MLLITALLACGGMVIMVSDPLGCLSKRIRIGELALTAGGPPTSLGLSRTSRSG